MRTVGNKVHSHNSNCIYSVAKSNGDSIEFSLSIAEQRAVGFIPAWSLASLQSYPHCSKHTLLPPNTLSLFRPWLPKVGTQGHCNIYNIDYSLQEPYLIL